MTIYIGLDVHSKHSTFEIQDADGKILGTGEVPTGPVGFSELKSKYNVPDGTACALETGTVAFYCARQLAALKLKPVVVDAAEVRNKASRRTQKSDRRRTLRGSQQRKATKPPSSLWLTVCCESCMPCCAMGRTLTRPSSTWKRSRAQTQKAKRMFCANALLQWLPAELEDWLGTVN